MYTIIMITIVSIPIIILSSVMTIWITIII